MAKRATWLSTLRRAPPGFAASDLRWRSVGLCLFAAHPQDEWWDFDLSSGRYPARSVRRAVKWFKENW